MGERVSLTKLAEDFEDTFAPRCLKIRPKKGGKLIPFNPNPWQRAVVAEIKRQRDAGKPPRIIILKSRRLGFSTLVQGLMFHDGLFNPYRDSLVVAHEEKTAIKLNEMARIMYENLPPALRPKKKFDNKREIKFGHNNSSFSVVIGKGGGRGYGAQMIHLSEFAHMEKPEELLAAVMDTVPSDPDTLIVIESTPNGIGNAFHDIWVNAKAGRNDWTPFFFPWYTDPANSAPAFFTDAELDEDERELVRKYQLSLDQIAWRRNKIKNDYNGDKQIFLQEQPSDDRTCFLHSGRPLFDQGLDYYREIACKPDEMPPPAEFQWTEDEKKVPDVFIPKLIRVLSGRWRIYEGPQPRMLYAEGADCASGIARGDFAPLCVLNRHTMAVDAVMLDRIPADLQAREAMKAGHFYNAAILNWEVNNHGIAFGMEVQDRYPNLYYRRVAIDDAGQKVTDRMGWETTPRTRTGMFDLARKYVREHTGIIRDPDLIDQMERMVYDDRDRPDHQRGGYSDLVVAFIMALIAHKGDADTATPLEPLTDEQKARALEALDHALALGHDTLESIAAENFLTADELLALDNERLEAKRFEEEVLGGSHW